MLTYLLLGAVVLAMALRYGGSVIRWRQDRSAAPPARDDPSDRDGEREEARLATALLAGDIPLAWYRHRMTELAARDDACHPLVVPPKGELPGGSTSM